MSVTNISGCLILDSQLTCDGDININATGKVIPIPTKDVFFNCRTNENKYTNGEGRTIKSLQGDITIDGTIDGDAIGYGPNKGPGVNSLMEDYMGNTIKGYGATHAGLGSPLFPNPGVTDFFVKEHVLTQDDIDAKAIMLDGYPNPPTDVALDVVHGVSQHYPNDFAILGNVISWDGFPLEDDLVVGDTLRVEYYGAGVSKDFPGPVPPYGSFEAPTSLGSGSTETSGGSAIKIDAQVGKITVNGTITMDGQDGVPGKDTGGGSGGSVWLEGWLLQGTGTITAEGGHAVYSYGGGGGGGYISLWYHNTNSSSYNMSVIGKSGGTDGKVWIQKIDPIFEDKFTGHILNQKWWEVVTPPISLDNQVEMDATSDLVHPEMRSLFEIEGQQIITEVDINPFWGEPNFYSANLEWYLDDENWVRVSRRQDQFVGSYAVNNVITSFSSVGHSFGSSTLRLHKNDSTFFFQFYDSTSTPQTIFDDVIEPFKDRRFKASMSLEKQAVEEGDIIVEYFSLNDNNINQKYVPLAGPITGPDNATLSVIEGGYQLYGLDFYVEGNRLRWDQSGLDAFSPPFNFQYTQYFTLTASDIFEGYVELNIPPELTGLMVDAQAVALNIVGGTSQELGVDFDVHVPTHRVFWRDLPLEDKLVVGDTIRVQYAISPWYIPPHETLESKLEIGDLLRVMYSADTTNLLTRIGFDDFRLLDGVIYNHEANKPVVYVDPNHGSDTSSGNALEPLQNLFVAADWARRGGIVVLYDGTHNSASVTRKNLTIMGASGARPLVTTENHLDATGSGWEKAALTFHRSQSVVKNLVLSGTEYGVYIESGDNFEISDTEIRDATTGIRFVKTDPLMMRNEIHAVNRGIDLTGAVEPYVYSNVIYDTSVAVRAVGTEDLTVQSNTIDDCTSGILFDESSSGIVASNNITNCSIGIDIGADSSPVSIFTNNFYGTTTQWYGADTTSSGNFDADPLYVDQTGRDYMLQSGSPDIGAGLETYDNYFIDFRGASRADASPSEVGAYEFIGDGSHIPGEDYYVSGSGNDFFNYGNLNDPFRTLDRAFRDADSTVLIEGGHYDTFYLGLREEKLDLQTLNVWIERQGHAISYVTLSQHNVNNKFIPLPGVMIDPDRTDFNIAINPLDKPVDGTSLSSGPAQEYGTDFVIDYGRIRWDGLGMDGILAPGDILRLIFFGNFTPNPIETAVQHPHFSNIDLGRTIFVSPSGSDSTVLGGDGTNTGGDGSIDKPYRTIDRAIQDSTNGDSIILRAGEYPLFTGADDRVLVPVIDTTAFNDKYERRYVEDLFPSKDFRNWNHLESNGFWNISYSGDSSVQIADGHLSLTYDGSGVAEADSSFNMVGDFEVTTVLRNAVDPVKFSVYNSDTTVTVQLDSGDYTANVWTGGMHHYCWGHLDIDVPAEEDFFTEYVCVSSDDTRRGFTSLSFSAYDCTSSAVNVVGGTSQDYGSDYIIQGERLVWRGYGMDGEVEPGEILRVMYRAKELSDPVKLKLSLNADYLSIRAYDYNEWSTLMLRNLITSDSTWGIRYHMDETGEPHLCQVGRGFGSQLLVVADDFINTEKDQPYLLRTQRRTIALYQGEPT